MTPEQFAEAMREIIDRWGGRDPESCHEEIDGLMQETLEFLGYDEGIALLASVQRWFA